mmetsp:Transcript_86469/g.242018  ORF Transcript_86469/g.242018 Transcript_86469/m.242018 type:complete len:220 (+) Transcript_86469:142-801(+)
MDSKMRSAVARTDLSSSPLTASTMSAYIGSAPVVVGVNFHPRCAPSQRVHTTMDHAWPGNQLFNACSAGTSITSMSVVSSVGTRRSLNGNCMGLSTAGCLNLYKGISNDASFTRSIPRKTSAWTGNIGMVAAFASMGASDCALHSHSAAQVSPLALQVALGMCGFPVAAMAASRAWTPKPQSTKRAARSGTIAALSPVSLTPRGEATRTAENAQTETLF